MTFESEVKYNLQSHTHWNIILCTSISSIIFYFIEEKMLFSDYKVEYIIPMIMIAFLDYIYMLW